MAINKFQRSRVTFDLSAKGAHIGVPSETIWQIELNFHMKTPYNKLVKTYTNCSSHMTKMANMAIYGKKT